MDWAKTTNEMESHESLLDFVADIRDFKVILDLWLTMHPKQPHSYATVTTT